MEFIVQNENKFGTQRLLRAALLLWMGYFLLIGLIDWVYSRDAGNLLTFYTIQTAVALAVLLISYIPMGRRSMEDAKLPVAIILLATLPSLVAHGMLKLTQDALLFSPDGMTFRLTPVLLIGLLLTARKYEMRYVVLFCFGAAAANLAGMFLPFPFLVLGPGPIFSKGPPFPKGLLVTLIQTISLLLVGFFTSRLMESFRSQREALKEANLQLRLQASTRKELTISQERNRMARELHDTLAHTLTGLTVQLQAVSAYWDVEPEQAQKMLASSLDSTRSGLAETRRALKDLRAAPLEDLGLSLAVQELAKAVAGKTHMELKLKIKDPLPAFESEINQCLYRVAQEALSNVDFHSNASSLFVQLFADEQNIHLMIKDDGIGFELKSDYPDHWGIQGMHERAKLVDGEFMVRSQLNEGTEIILSIPYVRGKSR
ncbi:MAG: sensor histidine kinase [Anaerolineae bacterium]